jgi:hypothetical protein
MVMRFQNLYNYYIQRINLNMPFSLLIFMKFPFGYRRVQLVSGSCYINLPRPWALANRLEDGGKVSIDLLDDGSLKISPVPEEHENRIRGRGGAVVQTKPPGHEATPSTDGQRCHKCILIIHLYIFIRGRGGGAIDSP